MQRVMQAYVCRRYGGPEVVELADVPKPVPRSHEVLVRIHATTVSAGDWRVRTLNVPKGFGLFARLALGFTAPRQPILGSEMAGMIESVGTSVTRFKPGDEVFAFPGAKMGCHAQYRAVAEDRIALKPANLSFEEAATLSFGGSTALYFLEKAQIRRGDRVLVIGASGAVGTAVVQLAKHFGASVTGVTSTTNVQLVSSLGADRVIDYTREDFTRGSDRYDIIADTVRATSYARCQHVLNENGRLLVMAGGVPDLLSALWVPMTGTKKRVIAGIAEERPAYVGRLAELARTGALRPVIDRRYEFPQMAEAHAYVETGRKRGSVVVRVREQPA